MKENTTIIETEYRVRVTIVYYINWNIELIIGYFKQNIKQILYFVAI